MEQKYYYRDLQLKLDFHLIIFELNFIAAVKKQQ